MHASPEASHPTAGSLSAFLAGPVINGDAILSRLLTEAESLGSTFFVFDYLHQQTVYVGPSITDLNGYSAEETCGGGPAHVMQITSPSDIPSLMLLQSGYVQEAKGAGFDLGSVRFHDYNWTIVHKDGSKVPVVSTGVVLTYSTQNDFIISAAFHVRNDKNVDAKLMQCKEHLRKIKQRHNEVHRHATASQDGALYLIHHVNQISDSITQRERQVLGMLAQGHSTDVIAATLQIAVNTVESHRKKLLQKFEARNSAELIKKASKVFWLS